MFEQLLARIARKLDEADIPYMIIGGQAVLLYGEPRLTKDIDISLGADRSELAKVKKLTEEIGLTSLPDDADQFVEETMVLPTIEEDSGVRVDFIFSHSGYERQAIRRAEQVEIERTQVAFASLEDLIIHKVVACRPRDLEDIRVILLKNPEYDQDYIHSWLAEFDRSLSENYLPAFKRLESEVQ